MVVYEDHCYQECSLYPDTNFIPENDERQPKWVVDDTSELANKIRNIWNWTPVEDEDGNLIDIEEVPYVPSQEELNQIRIDEIKNQLNNIDAKRIRPLAAISLGTADEEDIARLQELEDEANVLREELRTLTGSPYTVRSTNENEGDDV